METQMRGHCADDKDETSGVEDVIWNGTRQKGGLRWWFQEMEEQDDDRFEG